MTSKAFSRALPRWLSALLFGTALLLLAFMAWSLISSQRRVSAEHRRNFHVLTVLADGIASWPPTLKTMARANLMLSQLLPPEPRDALAGWQARADLYNPRLGRVRINYAIVAGGTPCPWGSILPPPFSRAGDMTINGRLPLSDILAYDLKKAGQLQRSAVLVGAGRVIAMLNTNLSSKSSAGLASGDDAWLTKAEVCFRTIVRLSDVVELSAPGMPIVSLLILSDDKNIVTQLGSERLPVETREDLVASRPISQSIVSMITKSGDKPPPPEAAPTAEKLGPYPVEVAGSAYTAYARPFTMPPLVTGANPRFFAIGLIPRRAIGKDMSDLPPTTLTGFALALAFLLALWPVVKLRLIGGGEAMSRLEIWSVGFGLVAATALATLAVRFAYDVMKARNAASRDAQEVAGKISDHFAEELRRSVDVARLSLARIRDDRPGQHPDGNLDVSPVEVAGFGEDRPPQPPPAARETCPGPPGERSADLPPLESFFVADAEGEQLSGTSILVWRRCAGGRPNVAVRRYFRQAATGHLLESAATPLDGKNGPAWKQGKDVPWTLSARYAIEQVRSQADGISKTIIAFEATPIAKAVGARGSGPQAAAATTVTVLPALIAPALPPRLDYVVVDTADPEWPVIFHADPSRVGLEKLRRELVSRTADDAVARLMPSPSRGALLPRTVAAGSSAAASDPPPCRSGHDPPTVCFNGIYDGRYRLFAGRALPGTPWVVLVYADVPAVDLPATQRVEQAIGYLMAVAIAVGLLILIERHILRLRRHPRWAAAVSALRQRFGLAEHDARAVRRRFMLANFLFLLALGAILLDLLLGWLALTLLLAVPAGLVTFFYLLPIGRQAFDPRLETGRAERSLSSVLVALLVLTGVVPAFAIYSDASRYITARQASQDVTIVSDALERAFRAKMDVLTSFNPTLQSAGDQPNWLDGLCPPSKVEIEAENVFVKAGCPAVPARMLNSDSWAENGARMIGDVFAPAYIRCAKGQDCSASTSSISLERRPRTPLGLFLWSALAMLAGMLGLLLWVAMHSVMRGLFGIGLSLEVMTFPRLPQKGGMVDLRKDNWTMIVRPPLALSRSLVIRGTEVDVSTGRGYKITAPATQDEADRAPIVFTNLEMTMRDPEGRQKALATIEAITAWHDRLRAESRPRPPLVMLAELAPLDRLLQAYEREAAAAQSAGEARPVRSREKMRWSRLLERFHTYFFAAMRHVDPLDFSRPAPARMAVEEVAFLPEQAIDALLEDPPEPPEPPPGRAYRLTQEEYAAAYTGPVHAWALSLNAPSPEAVVDYLRAMLAEHYESIWINSSWAERLAMHHLARGRLMNMETASAMGALIRRGLVVADPLPRLMNRSFSRFVLQTEKPASIQQWRNSLDGGAWQAARWPLAAMIGIGVLAIVLLMINAGQTPEALLPLLIAAGPALLQTLGVIRK